MKSFMKIIALICMLVSSFVGITACDESELYTNMVVSYSIVSGVTQDAGTGQYYVTYNSDDEDANYFTIDFVVSNIAAELDSSLSFSYSGDTTAIELEESTTPVLFTTRNRYRIIRGGTVEIRAISNENSDKYCSITISVVVPVKALRVTGGNTVFPVVRGQRTNLTINDDYVTFEPANTTQREVVVSASLINGYDYVDIAAAQAAINEINNLMADSEGEITIPNNFPLNSFSIRLTSAHKETAYVDAIIRVLDKPDVSNIQLYLPKDESALDGEFKMLTLDEETNRYKLTLAYEGGEGGKYNNYTDAIVQMFYGADLIDGIYTSVYDPFTKRDVSIKKYSLGLKNLTSNEGSFTDTDIITASVTKDSNTSNTTIHITRGTAVGTYNLVFQVFYNGYEDRFAPLELSIDVTVKVFPSYIKLFESQEDAEEIIDFEDFEVAGAAQGVYQSGDIYIYQNYNNVNGTPVYIDVWGDNRLDNQDVIVSTSDEKVIINGVSNTYETLSGVTVYISKADSAYMPAESVYLTVRSAIFADVECVLELVFVDAETSVEIVQDVVRVALDPLTYNDNKNAVNQTLNLVEDESILVFTGLKPKTMPTEANPNQLDYSEILVEIDNLNLASHKAYDPNLNDILIDVKNNIGYTRITVVTPNGFSGSFVLAVYYELTDSNVELKFDHFDDVYNGVGTTQEALAKNYAKQFLKDGTYSWYVNVGGLRYTTLNDGVINYDTVVLKDGNILPENQENAAGELVKVYSVINNTIMFSEPLVGDSNYLVITLHEYVGEENATPYYESEVLVYIKVSVCVTMTYVNLDEDMSETIYSLDTLNPFTIGVHEVSDRDSNGYAEFHLYTGPSYATTLADSTITWSIRSGEQTLTLSEVEVTDDYTEYVTSEPGTDNKIYVRIMSDNMSVLVYARHDENDGSRYNFDVSVRVEEMFVNQYGETIIDAHTISRKVFVEIAEKIADISTNAYGDLVSFDIRKFEVTNGV
ncbi:MAG: hypothetical protein IJW28_02300, partial [Clostridia bacterium]|nr:hypothetical protein [Clostridia bacterium]